MAYTQLLNMFSPHSIDHSIQNCNRADILQLHVLAVCIYDLPNKNEKGVGNCLPGHYMLSLWTYRTQQHNLKYRIFLHILVKVTTHNLTVTFCSAVKVVCPL